MKDMQVVCIEKKIPGILKRSRINGVIETLRHNREQTLTRNDGFERVD